jgi:chromosome segregation ATPase
LQYAGKPTHIEWFANLNISMLTSRRLKKLHASSQESLSQDVLARDEAEKALKTELATKASSLSKALSELDELKVALAAEKSAKAAAQADLDAVKTKKPDTSEADGLRKDLQALKDQHQAALMTAQQESAEATKQHLETKAALEKAQEEVASHKTAAEEHKKTSATDYGSMHESMTELLEDANNKIKELEANLKVKEAELVEAKVSLMLCR